MFGAMPATASEELAEAPRALQQRLDQEQAPSVADAFEGRRQGRGRCHGQIVGHRS